MVGQFFQSSGYINMAASLMGLIIGMRLTFRDDMRQLLELTTSISGRPTRILAKIITALIVALILTLWAYVQMIIFIWLSGSEYIQFNDQILSYIALNWGIVFLSCGYIGYAIATIIRSNWWTMIVIILLWLLFTPLNIYIVYFIPNIRLQQITFEFLSTLNQGERTVELGYQQFHGLNISWSVFSNRMFFFMLSCALLYYSIYLELRRASIQVNKIKAVFVISLLLLSSATFLVIERHLDLNRYYHVQEDYYIAKDLSQLREQILDGYFIEKNNKQVKQDIQVHKYDVDLSFFQGKINYKAQLEIEAKATESEMVFTLYRDLQVKKAYVNDRVVEFTQRYDELKIEWPNHLQNGVIQLEVSGFIGGLHYPSNQAYYLAEDFPWLPIPGRHIVMTGEPALMYHRVQLEQPNLLALLKVLVFFQV